MAGAVHATIKLDGVTLHTLTRPAGGECGERAGKHREPSPSRKSLTNTTYHQASRPTRSPP